MTAPGYEFKNLSLLEEALTTPSFRMEAPGARDNQRLEFLGDAILGLLAAEKTYRAFPDEPEGRLTVRRAHMVSAPALCAAAHRFGLAAMLRRNRGAAPLAQNAKTLADAVEAVIGAAYLDGGLPAARAVFDALGLSAAAEDGEWSENPKGDLQIAAQAMRPPRHPEYELLNTTGPGHAPVFTVAASVEGVGRETASAGNLKEAEAIAAAALLRRMKEMRK